VAFEFKRGWQFWSGKRCKANYHCVEFYWIFVALSPDYVLNKLILVTVENAWLFVAPRIAVLYWAINEQSDKVYCKFMSANIVQLPAKYSGVTNWDCLAVLYRNVAVGSSPFFFVISLMRMRHKPCNGGLNSHFWIFILLSVTYYSWNHDSGRT
jgi:hypothetical protein